MSRFFVEFKLAPCSETERRAVPDGVDTIFDGRNGPQLYRESYSPGAFLPFTNQVPFRLGHDTGTIGHVEVVVAHGKWHLGTATIEDGPLQNIARRTIKPGSRVSLAGRSIRRYDDPDLRIVRHEIVRLEEVALVGDDEIAGLPGAVVTRVHEAKPAATRTADAGIKPRGSDQAKLAELRRAGLSEKDIARLGPPSGWEIVETDRAAWRRMSTFKKPAGDDRRYLSRGELDGFAELAREFPVDRLADLLRDSGDCERPDSSIGVL